ncbi:MAG: hypothetical protein EAX95_10905 [Candidatus Thorarchaeota archaeon]|nr:hypothetical protein [Candidatus Thorarchaeota archaeon]
MREIRVNGTYREMGLAFGETLSSWYRKFIPNKEHLEFAWECEHAAQRFAPDILEEIRGVSEASGTKYESLISTHLAPAFLFGCTLFAVKGEDTISGSPLFARQMDWIKDDIDALLVIHSEPDGGRRSIGFSFGDCGRYGGQNDEGLTIGSAYIAMYKGSAKPGIRMNISTRWALDKFSTTNETVDYLKRIPHTEAVAFLVADSAGTIARVEASPEKTTAAYLEEGIEVVTNFFRLEGTRELDKGWNRENIVYKHFNRTKDWYEKYKGNITLDKAKEFCSDPANGICQYSDGYEEITIWSWVAETKPVRLQLAPGPPWETKYTDL